MNNKQMFEQTRKLTRRVYSMYVLIEKYTDSLGNEHEEEFMVETIYSSVLIYSLAKRVAAENIGSNEFRLEIKHIDKTGKKIRLTHNFNAKDVSIFGKWVAPRSPDQCLKQNGLALYYNKGGVGKLIISTDNENEGHQTHE